ncbi:phosphatidylinositol-specific phospholipase C [Streptomyces jumonjinensis]|uniref:1-phosphatidylinositol phosphodiesterase n=1 Tax=Streptomyces jumonjinensis TaxID=1945 RepID=A0A646KQI4_STRJU|nr:phosphatidylinositol-specific phospholipase C [Streptomyces jumonjinensis]MQT04360.1 phosphatidylinositol-specific phospholipase C domain-containing protein [Streptomyces jumonjinensis]
MYQLHNWMSHLDDGLGLQDLTIPGTHESGATHGAVLPMDWAQCQSKPFSIAKQLAAGIRYLDIRCRNFNGSLLIHHGSVYQELSFLDVINDCYDFLKTNKQETVLMRIKHEYHNDDEGDDGTDAGFKARFEEVSHKFPGLFHTESSIPTLDKARGKIVVLSNVAGLPGIPWGDASIQDHYDTDDADGKVGEVKSQFDKALKDTGKKNFYINHLSCYATLASPAHMAKRVVFRVLDHVWGIRTEKLRPSLGIVPMDYADDYTAPSLIDELIAWNEFGPRQDAPRSVRITAADLLQFDDGSTDPRVYGSIRVLTTHGATDLWNRDKDHRVEFDDSKGSFISGPTAEYPTDRGFSIEVNLWDYDSTSGDDQVARGRATWTPADAAGSFTHDFLGEDDGKVRISYTAT